MIQIDDRVEIFDQDQSATRQGDYTHMTTNAVDRTELYNSSVIHSQADIQIEEEDA